MSDLKKACWGVTAMLLALGPSSEGADAPKPVLLTIHAGLSERLNTPVQVETTEKTLPSAPGGGKVERLSLQEIRDGRPVGAPIVAQLDRPGEDVDTTVRITWVLPGQTTAGSERTFQATGERSGAELSPWSFVDRADGSLEVKNRKRTVFRYNARPVAHPNYDERYTRDAYIHPAYAPSGALITGDFSKFHPHHRGFFLAYAKTQVGSSHHDFWNIQSRTGRVVSEGIRARTSGPVTARFTAEHDWKAPGVGTVLRERWDVEIYDIPGTPYWLFDLTSTQRASGEPVQLQPYRYGGMAYRGPDSFLPLAKLDVLTSQGLDRRQGDQKPAEWVDLTGPIDRDSKSYAGALICDHPANVNHPTVARIHPSILPFFSYVPAHDVTVSITKDRPLVFRYRILIHDGRPDRGLDERTWRDFAEPPRVAMSNER
jgi:hypothetical protein